MRSAASNVERADQGPTYSFATLPYGGEIGEAMIATLPATIMSWGKDGNGAKVYTIDTRSGEATLDEIYEVIRTFMNGDHVEAVQKANRLQGRPMRDND